ncbi:MAG: hypothetical protein JWM11_7832 [Planctomycetaceae bacterium]|nr:hypothetical protein [Planctomycetaceae bacterium]
MTGPTFLGEQLESAMLNQNAELTRRIDTLTFRQIGNLRVECSGCRVVLHGQAKTYYVKQLATQAVLDLFPGANVTNSVDVTR